MVAKYVVGIDLGTTNTVLGYARLDSERLQVEILPIPQLIAAGTVEPRSSLPSFIYLGGDAEAQSGAFNLPWSSGESLAVGEFARRQSADVPQRTVGAAKSWLCHSRVDRHQPILPWNAPPDVPKISPVTASRRYLEHLGAAWQAAFPDAPLSEQLVVLTVPASFDAAARELTREAAQLAGLPINFVLLEEPQAAVYAWLAKTGDRWRRKLKVDDVLLVCDVGGGTTDFTLVAVAEERGELTLRRVAVGNHLLVGGDNMDLALAYHLSGRFEEKGIKLDPWQSVSLWHACRHAKEQLLRRDAPAKFPVSILGRGSRLIGGTVSVEVGREEVCELLLEGFLPPCAPADKPQKRRVSGFQEIGLPFESDTAITRHLAAFLHAHGDNAGGQAHPTHLLFNGGAFKADVLRDRLVEVLGSWSPGDAVPEMLDPDQDLDHSVARGAVYYGWAKQHGGVRIRGGTARSYYVGIETSGLAIPGAPRPLKALCVVPFGMEEGTDSDVPSQEIGLVVGETATFRFFSSSVRKQDRVGDLVSEWGESELEETDSLEAALPVDETIEEPYVPVRFHARITELGVFELWCVGVKNDRRWKLEFSVRETD